MTYICSKCYQSFGTEIERDQHVYHCNIFTVPVGEWVKHRTKRDREYLRQYILRKTREKLMS